MAAPTFVAAGTYSSGAGALTPGLPSGWAENDIFLLMVHNETSAVSTPSGWAHVASSPRAHNTADIRVTVFWKRAGASESGPTVADAGNRQGARIIAIRGCPVTGDPWDITGSDGNDSFGTSISVTGVTTTEADTLIVVTTSCEDDNTHSSWANSNLTSVTERVDSNTGTLFGAITAMTGVKASAGAIGTSTATCSGSSFHVSHVVALKGGAAGTSANAGTVSDTVTSNAPRGGVGAKAQVIG